MGVFDRLTGQKGAPPRGGPSLAPGHHTAVEVMGHALVSEDFMVRRNAQVQGLRRVARRSVSSEDMPRLLEERPPAVTHINKDSPDEANDPKESGRREGTARGAQGRPVQSLWTGRGGRHGTSLDRSVQGRCAHPR